MLLFFIEIQSNFQKDQLIVRLYVDDEDFLFRAAVGNLSSVKGKGNILTIKSKYYENKLEILGNM